MRRFLFLIVLAAAAVVAVGTRPAPPPSLSIDTLVDICHPSRAAWSPDGVRIAYVRDCGGVQNVYVATPGGEPAPLTKFDAELIDSLNWSADGTTLLFSRAGDLWKVGANAAGASAQRAWTTPPEESGIALSPDRTRAAFAREGDLWVRDLARGTETRLTTTPPNESAPVWSSDGTRLAFTVAGVTRRQDTPDFSGAKIAFNWLERTTTDVGVVPAVGGKTTVLGATVGSEGSPNWIDAGRIVFQRISPDLRTRDIIVSDVSNGASRTIATEHDPKWWSIPGSSSPEPNPSPDGKWIAFLSDRNGWDHLYVVATAGGTPIQITTGRMEVRHPRWAPDGRRLAFDVNEDAGNPGRRHVAVAAIDATGHGVVTNVTSGRGTDTEPLWRPDGQGLVYQHTDPRSSAELFVAAAGAGASAQRVTESLPPSFDRAQIVEPQFVRYPASDGQQVPAFLFVPSGMSKTPTHPAIVWIHGDGTNENYDGWHVQRNYAVYYSVHQYLLQRGYVVLAVDYRGSIGYGRDWRQGHYRDLGGKDYEDVAAGVAFLKSTGYVDTSRIGVWGLSYGGFMTLQALTRTPELFRCGIDVAGVDDWRDWHKDPDGPWINARMGSPAENAELYRRTAPIEHIDKIVRPLLVLHGTADVNVPFYESVRLVDALLKARKDVDFMMYPGEFHYFWRSHVLRDAWRRVEDFFASHLSPQGSASD